MDDLKLQVSSTEELQQALDILFTDINGWIRRKEREVSEARSAKLHAEHLVIIQRDLAQDICRARSEDEILNKALDSLLMVNGYDCGGAYLFDDDGSLKLRCHRNLSEAFIDSASRFGPDDAQARLVKLGKPIFKPYTELSFASEIRRLEGLTLIAIVPIRDGDRVLGCFNVASHQHNEVDDPALDSLISIVAYVGEAIAKERNAYQCKEARMQFEILAEAATDGIAIMDSHKIVRCNKSFGTLVASTESTLIGKSILDLIVPEDHSTYFYHEARESEDPFKIRLLRGDSPSIAVLAELQHLHQKNGYENCVVLVAHDWKQRA